MLFLFGQSKGNDMATLLDDGGGSVLSCFNNCDNTSRLPPRAITSGISQLPVPLLHHKRQIERQAVVQQTEDLLASEMQRLTVQERSQAMDDIHCVGEELKETKEMVVSSLQEFEIAVQKEQNPIYELAAAQNSAYVEDLTFRLKFLRANLHNVNRSVRQMMNFLRYKATYFGNDKIARDITLDDLNEEDMKVMKSGLFHVQDGRDQTGRVVVYLFNTLLGKFKAENVIRVAYYIWFNIMIPFPEVQMKGLVGVYLDVAKPGEKLSIPGFNFMLTVLNFTCSLPMRYSGMHLCLKGSSDKAHLAMNNNILGLAMNAFPQYARVRSRVHCGSMLELQYSLKSYGLPVDTCPVDTSGNIRTDILNSWFDQHVAEEEIKQDFLLSTTSFPSSDAAADAGFFLNSQVNQQHFLNPRIMSDDDEETNLDGLFDGDYNKNNNNDGNTNITMNNNNYQQGGGDGMIMNHQTSNDAAHVIPMDFDHDRAAAGAPLPSNNSNNNNEEETPLQQEEQQPPPPQERQAVVVQPTRNDVLLGRGRDIQNHEGNVRFRKFLEPYSDEYDQAPRSKRRKIAIEMNEVLTNKGIRFLKQAGLNEWIESDSESAEKKIAQLFRSLRKKK